MDFSKLKDLARTLGGILVMDGDQPQFVIIAYEKYMHQPATEVREDDQLIEGLNKEILALKEEIQQKETSEIQEI